VPRTPMRAALKRGHIYTLGAALAALLLPVAAMFAAAPASAATTTGPITGYQGLCLDDRAASTANLNPIQVYTCNGTAAQSWTVNTGNNTLQVLGKCLDVNGAGTANGTTDDLDDCNGTGAQTTIEDCTGAPNQHWTLP
jgi:hypothetical protein